MINNNDFEKMSQEEWEDYCEYHNYELHDLDDLPFWSDKEIRVLLKLSELSLSEKLENYRLTKGQFAGDVGLMNLYDACKSVDNTVAEAYLDDVIVEIFKEGEVV